MRLLQAAALLSAALLLTACGQEAPTDKEMKDVFTSKRAAFTTLQTELCKLKYDLTVNVDPAWTSPQMPEKDEERFRELLTDIGATQVKYLRTCQIWITVWRSGIGADAAYKKYRYGLPMYRINEIKRPEKPGDPPEKDLNEFLGKRVRIASFQKKLDTDWWIELDHWQ